MISQHKDEKEIQNLKGMNDSEVKTAIDKLRKEGIFQQNVVNLKEGKPLIPERCQAKDKPTVCSICRAFISSGTFYKHRQKCRQVKDTAHEIPYRLKPSTLIAPITLHKPNSTSDVFKNDILNRFADDRIGELCRTDRYIITVGYRAWERNSEGRKGIMGLMRNLARLLDRMQDFLNDKSLTLLDILNQKLFYDLETCLNNLCEGDTKDDQKYGLKLTLRSNINEACKMFKTYFLVDKNYAMVQQIDEFLAILDLEKHNLFTKALRKMEEKQFEKARTPVELPKDEEINQLIKFIKQRISEMTTPTLELDLWDTYTYNRARVVVVARLTLYNARRGEEAAKLQVSHFEDAMRNKWINRPYIKEIKDPLEKTLYNRIKLAYLKNKGSRMLIPILIPVDCIPLINKIISSRNYMPINPKNQFVFANNGRTSTDPCRGWDTIREVVIHAGIKNPSRITATKIRHKMSTDYTLLELTKAEKDAFFKHMGHAQWISENIYQCPPDYLEICRIGRILNAADKGLIPKATTTKLDNLPVDAFSGKCVCVCVCVGGCVVSRH